jgi:four helix bundle protein
MGKAKVLMTQKQEFIEKLKKRTKQFAVDVVLFCNYLKKCKSSSVIEFQLVKSATSAGANYRAACRARSKPEFFSKVCIVVEEIDEAEYWLEVIEDANLTNDSEELNRLKTEANEINRIMSRAKDTSYSKP